MDDASCVCSRQSRTCLAGDVQGMRQGKTACIGQALLEGNAFQKLHENVGCTISGSASVKHIDDVGMADTAGSACFVEEPANQLRIPCQLGVQDLDGGAAVDERILDKVDLSKAAFPEQPNHTVVSKELAYFHRHFRAGRNVTPIRVADKRIPGLV